MVGHQQNESESFILADYCDGLKFKTHVLFGNGNPAIVLFLYYDEVELCNPLGSKRTKHKIGE